MANNLTTFIHDQRTQFIAVQADKTVEFEREAQFALQIIDGNSYLQGIALKNLPSLKSAITNIAAIGISLNPASKLAYLVPRDNKVCLDISYMGLMHLAQQCGAIQWGKANIVRDGDIFELTGIASEPVHKYNPFDKERNSREAVGAYVVVKTDVGDYLTECMGIDEIFSIRDRSSAWKAYKAKGVKCPWVTDQGEMIKKTVIKRAAKMWPRRDRLDAAIHHLNVDGGEGLEIDVTPTDKEAPKIPAMSAERFEANLAKYGPAIRDGRATAEQIITGLQEKATLSAEQIQRLKDCAPVIIEGEAA